MYGISRIIVKSAFWFVFLDILQIRKVQLFYNDN